MLRGAAVVIILLMAGCTSHSGDSQDDAQTRLATTLITLPNGKPIHAELATTPEDQQQGLMFRTRLAPDRGMLFVFPESGDRPFWMYHTLIPLDILWLDENRAIVYISANTPPCPSEKPDECPNYGGGNRALYVLELAGGVAGANNLKPGDRLQF